MFFEISLISCIFKKMFEIWIMPRIFQRFLKYYWFRVFFQCFLKHHRFPVFLKIFKISLISCIFGPKQHSHFHRNARGDVKPAFSLLSWWRRSARSSILNSIVWKWSGEGGRFYLWIFWQGAKMAKKKWAYMPEFWHSEISLHFSICACHPCTGTILIFISRFVHVILAQGPC